jgi:pyruvate dehydrogenase E1 component alpha subunit
VLLLLLLLQELERKVRAEVEEAVEWAKASPEPPLTDLFTQVYVAGTEPPALRGRDNTETHRY